MKINKKLLMAALAGAIVVGGGVNTYAADEGIPEKVDDSGNPMFEYPDFDDQANPRFETENNEFEEEKDVSDNWFNPAEHPFEENKEDEKSEESETDDTDPEELEENNENGYKTEAAAKAAAEEALKKDEVNNAYEVVKGADGNYHYVLKIEDEEEPEEKPEENNETGYKTEAAAKAAAEEALKKDEVNNAYEVVK
ncbi:MAG: DUF5633 domain-containing protein, partial [Finegoldia magna]|uniref:DUF5633 domain-containing protein n=1 Tax=Finegoldia magna TaxID=1260 RepID=UPI0029103A66